MIVTAGIATTARAKALTEDKVERLHEAWWQRPAADPLRRVDDLIGDISQDVFWAGLLIDIHQRAWEMFFVKNPRDLDPGAITVKEVRAYLTELKTLTIDQGWWFVYDLDGTRLGGCVARQVPLAEWEAGQPESLRRPFADWVNG